GGARDRGLLRRRARLTPQPGAPPRAVARSGCRPVGACPDLGAVRARPGRGVAARDRGLDPRRDHRRAERARRRKAPAVEAAHPRGGGRMAEKLQKTEDQGRSELGPERYAILRQAATEPPWSGELLIDHGDGIYRCGACGAELFRSDTKFDSGSGWPSFYAPAFEGAVEL